MSAARRTGERAGGKEEKRAPGREERGGDRQTAVHTDCGSENSKFTIYHKCSCAAVSQETKFKCLPSLRTRLTVDTDTDAGLSCQVSAAAWEKYIGTNLFGAMGNTYEYSLL